MGVTRNAVKRTREEAGLPVEHLLGRLWVFPTCLDLRTNWKRCELLARNLDFASTFLEFIRVIVGLLATRTRFQVSKQTGEGGARIDAHIVHFWEIFEGR